MYSFRLIAGTEQPTKDIEHKANKAMVGSQRKKHLVNKDNVLEVVDDALSVKEVHGGGQEVPVQALGGAQRSSSAGNIGDGNDFLEGNDLDCSDNGNHVNVSHEQCAEEARDHDQRP